MIQAFPLCWPSGYPRSPRPQRSRFRGSTFDRARQEVIGEIHRLGGTEIIISTNLPLRNDGYPYASARQPDDRGVAVYFTYKKQQVVFACDKWDQIGDNMKAIEKAIDAIRGLDRWGVSDMLNRAFTGFKALPEQATLKNWHEVLDVSANASEIEIKEAYRKKAMQCHPDKGGSSAMFHEIQNAYQQGLQK